jgi:hypothetical protein
MTSIDISAPVSFHEDVFYEYFKPFKHPKSNFDIWGGHGLETFGNDLAIAKNYDQDYVWTVVEGDVDEWIVPGFHRVNRVCYLLTKEPHKDAPIQFRIAREGRPLTQIGFARRITVLRRLLGAMRKV